ncbi:MAG: hypothetical protein AAF600_11995 [Bacteroidota bacterium]
MVYRLILLFLLVLLFNHTPAQTPSYDSLKQAIIQLNVSVNQIELNLEKSQKKFKSGILIATIGYSITIAGGLMLGRENDRLGQVLLVTGGATGIVGTYKMVDAFRFLTGDDRVDNKSR